MEKIKNFLACLWWAIVNMESAEREYGVNQF